MQHRDIIIRRAQPGDESALLPLMIELAEFEGYRADFCVHEGALTQLLFESKQVEVLVAAHEQHLVAMLVYYRLPFSYDLKPWWYIKELYVIPKYRSQHVGKRLMETLIQSCREQGGSKIRWDVLSENHSAQQFYQSLGAKADVRWELFSLKLN